LQRFGRNQEGGGLGFEIRTELRLGLTGLGGLRQKPYPELGQEAGLGRSRSGNQVKAFSLVRAGRLGQVRVAGLSGLSSGKAKTSPRAGFSLIPQPGLG
jgi:hypothetical protein